MAELILLKFTNHPELAKMLRSTDHTLLVEGNTWHDNVWGDCYCGRPECTKPGQNWLGHILMCVREVIRLR